MPIVVKKGLPKSNSDVKKDKIAKNIVDKVTKIKGETDVIKTTKNSDNLNELGKLYQFVRRFFLKQEAGKEKKPYTNSGLDGLVGCFDIPDELYPRFLKLYTEAVVAGYTPHITELHKEYGPILLDFDFVQSKEHSKRYYTRKTIKNIIRVYNKIIAKYLDVNIENVECFVLEKDKPDLRKNEYHDGIHIIYPDICTRPSLQFVMRNEFLKEIETLNIFKHIPLIREIKDVFDESVIYRNGWLLLGSTKNDNCSKYKITGIYSYIDDTLINKAGAEDFQTPGNMATYIRKFSIRKFQSEAEITPLANGIDPVEIESKLNKIKVKVERKLKDGETIQEMMGEKQNFINCVPHDDYIEAKNLVKMLSNKRSDEYHGWFQVGSCLHNLDYRLLEDWIEFSKKSPNKFVPGECEQLWKKMRHNKYSLASLHFWAKQDSPKKYAEYHQNRIEKLVKNGLKCNHSVIADLIIEKYKFRFKCASVKHKEWYEFKNHRWVPNDGGYTIRNIISNEIVKEYDKLQASMFQEVPTLENEAREKKSADALYLNKIINKLGDSGFKDGVLKACADKLYDPDFSKNLDENINLICFKNGVYDLENDIFRDGCPDDYISLHTGYDYVEYDPEDAISKDINKFLEQIQPDKDIRDYLLGVLSLCLSGSISFEQFYVFTGSGANGKSKLMELLKNSLGEYYKPLDVKVITGKRGNSSAASPEIADKKGIRACTLDEPEENDEINCGFMKLMTGGDELTARALFKDLISFKPQFKPFLLCNKLPKIRSNDEGTWRRLIVIPFNSKFISPANLTEKQKRKGLGPNQYIADDTLSAKLKDWKEMFAGLLLTYYRRFHSNNSRIKKETLKSPELVLKETKEYRKRCDVFQDFIDDYLEKTSDDKDTINMSNLYVGMRTWYKSNYTGNCPTKKDLKTYIQERYSQSCAKNGDVLIGYKIKDDLEGPELEDLDGYANKIIDLEA